MYCHISPQTETLEVKLSDVNVSVDRSNCKSIAYDVVKYWREYPSASNKTKN